MLKKIDKENKVLIVPDIHQDVGFFTKILAHEASRYFDVVVFLGDFFDSFYEAELSVEKTVDFLKHYHYLFSNQNVPQKAVWLAGNHDIIYLEDYTLKSNSKQFFCSGYSREKSKYIRQNLSIGFWSDTEIAVQVGDYILSHGGFHPFHFKPYINVFGQISDMNKDFKMNFLNLTSQATSWLWNVGECRGGKHKVGSPLWLDFHHEFEPIGEFKQIVGHSSKNGLAREIDGNYCLDCNQSCFGILQNNQLKIYYV